MSISSVAHDPSGLRATSPAEVGEARAWAKLAEWQLALPLSLAFAALFLAPLLLLVATSFFNDDKITSRVFASWVKFFGDPFNYKVIADTLLLGLKTVCATVIVGYPPALVYMDLGPRLQKVLLFVIIMPMLLSVVVRTFAWIVVGAARAWSTRRCCGWA